MPLVSADVFEQTFDVCIVGAGPAGLSCAFACHDRGLRVLLLDAGDKRPVPGSPDILAAEIKNTSAHDPIEIVAASALGGSSHWWGGRALPLDPADLRDWPISWDEMLPWWRNAAETLGAGSVIERPAPGKFSGLEKFDATGFESWAPDHVLTHRWRGRIAAKDGPAIVLRARVTGMQRTGGEISALDVTTPAGSRIVTAQHFVLTGGGLGSLRLMLLAQRSDPALFGGPNGPLGRGYMGHLTGSISDIVFSERKDAETFNFVSSGAGYLTRRRIRPLAATVEQDDICNAAFWLDHPTRGSAAHGSAMASARFLAACGVRLLAGEWGAEELPPLGPHFTNVGRSPLAAAAGLSQAAWMLAMSRIVRYRYLPRSFLSSGENGWRLVYHAEQRPNPANRISLAATQDSIGLPKLNIDFGFSEADAALVIRAHELLDRDLRDSGAGSLRWTAKDPQATVIDWARDGYHQLGGSPMSASPAHGVVDRNCRAHGLDNLWVASGSVFPTGGQANPTLTIMALACRVADRIASLRRYRAEDLAQPVILEQAS